MLPAISLLVYALAVARVTRLINADKITEAPRRWLSIRLWARVVSDEAANHWGGIVRTSGIGAARRWVARQRYDDQAEPPLSVYLITCPWCASIYVAAVAAPLVYFWGDSPWLFVPALMLAFSQFTGMASKHGE
jgi:hypothetical protein